MYYRSKFKLTFNAIKTHYLKQPVVFLFISNKITDVAELTLTFYNHLTGEIYFNFIFKVEMLAINVRSLVEVSIEGLTKFRM